MNETRGTSVHGDAEARRRGTLDAAAALLDEGGYAALTIRRVAQRAGTSTGLIYQYFADKQDIFISLLDESQAASADFVAALPRGEGVAALIETVIPESARQWKRVLRMTAAWRDTTGIGERDERASVQRLRTSSERYLTELRRAIVEAADGEGRTLRQDPAMLRFVVSGLVGVSDALVNHWEEDLDATELITFAAAAIARGITAEP
ncbi:TetR/AcrR family transcriptional regulator [Nocardioides jensenii]|uniref:TetR/AcrR family transcriptional regulator n=1 Tax=Nocardioides jensenii TaxID=1843 RepID=UPI0008327EFA|nr:TetR/AcrR family transcriptional regulator [Nocardioides jensenii]